MVRFLLAFTVMLCSNSHASTTIGYLHGTHFPEKGLNNSHPFIEVADALLLYKNSFNRSSFAIYKTIGEDSIKLKIGVTNGYKKFEEYDGYTYRQPLTIANDISLMLVPVLELNGNDNFKFIFAILGNSVNAGIGLNF